MKNFKLSKFILCLLIPTLFGGISGFFNQNSVELYEKLVLPDFAPPSFVFFKFHLIVPGFYLHMFLLLAVLWMTFNFFRLNKFAGILQIPYIIWLSFAGYLNYYIVLLNA